MVWYAICIDVHKRYKKRNIYNDEYEKVVFIPRCMRMRDGAQCAKSL